MKRSKLNQWLADLRSGKYTQTRGCLLKTDKTEGCCLGIYLLNNGPEPECLVMDGAVWAWRDTCSVINKMTLPQLVVAEDRWHNEIGSARDETGAKTLFNTSKGGFTALTEANDQGVPFTEIADIVEANPRLFFKSIEEDM